MAQSNASQMYVCALSGLSPVTDPVVTPSGYICSRKLLLTKLSENGGVDPFDDRASGGGSDRPRRSLDESQLIDLATSTSSSASAAPLPPKPPKATSLPSLLTLLREEFDAVLLELYDTRKALEETRRELSSALYQNDAAVRVLARVVRERDEARGALERYLTEKESGGGGKRAAERDGEEGEVAVEAPAKRAKTAAASDADADAEADPREDADAMIATWKALSKLRKAQTKRHKKSDEQLRAYRSLLRSRWSELQKANLHKSSADAGVLCLAHVAVAATEEGAPKEEYVVSGGRDGQAVVYDVAKGTILATMAKSPGQISSVAGAVIGGKGDGDASSSFVAVVTGSDEGTIRLHSLPSGGDEPILLAERNFDSSPVVSAVIHPSSDDRAVRVIVATRNGTIALIKYRLAGGKTGALETVFELTRREKEKEDVYTAGALHPDGLIYAAGTAEGTILIWDLKTKALAGSLESNDQQSIDCIAFSENGYHVATSSSAPSTAIQIWDLRKLQSIAMIHPNGTDGNGDEKEEGEGGDDVNGNTRVDIGRISSVAFDPSGVFLAYSGEGGTKVCVVKNVEDVVCALIPSKTGGRKSKKKKDEANVFRGGVVWGGVGTAGAEEKVWCASGCDGERPLRIWGVQATE